MRLEDLPFRWKQNLDRYLSRPEAEYPQISLADFANNLRLSFEDGSSATFKGAFYLLDHTFKEVAVFTEHCGYHIFPFCVERIETIDLNGNVITSDKAVID